MNRQNWNKIFSFLGIFALVALILGQACSGGFQSANVMEQSASSTGQQQLPPQQQAPLCTVSTDPGRTTLQRLNRDEYNNTLRDLLGITTRPADKFPADASASDFNNDGDALTLNTPLMALYLASAETSINEAFTLNRTRFMICAQTTAACARQILSAFTPRAYRRPPTTAELDKLVAVASVAQANGDTFENGIKLAMQATLVSPAFLYRVILLPSPNDSRVVKNLDAYELASRLSYFIWNSMPDDQLLNAAANGSLLQPEVTQAQVVRMLKDPKARALIDGFASQWLTLQRLKNAQPNLALYPEFSETLRQDMINETKALLQEIFSQDLSPKQILKADHTFVTARLASLYGISGVTSNTNLQRVSLAGSNRQGVLGHAGVLTMTSHADETSIILRGKWVLKNLLCDPPPPPPANFPQTEGQTQAQMSAGRLANVACASCHTRMDPIGLGLQNFNAIGKFRTVDEGGTTIDGVGRIGMGPNFHGAVELANIVASDERFSKCVTGKLMSYAIGRELQTADQCAVAKIGYENISDISAFSQLVQAIVGSLPFRAQRGEDPL